jgi:MarR family transcriptional regulator, temperature-dependent positive regulator of motility
MIMKPERNVTRGPQEAGGLAGSRPQLPTHHRTRTPRDDPVNRNNSANLLSHSPIHLLHRAGQCAGDIFQAEMKEGDLTPRQLAVLLTVAHDEGLSQTGLVEHTGIDRSTLADIVRRLQGKGLLKRRRTRADARAYAVKLTDEGRRALRIAEPLAQRVDARILDAVPARQRDQFIETLQSVVAALERAEQRQP